MVAEQVILRVRPGEKVRFPGLCVHCGRPASDKIVLMRKSGQLTRRLDAPICAECARQLSRRSGKEERVLRMSWPAAIGAAVLLAGMIFLILSFDTLWLRMSIAALVGLAGGAVVRSVAADQTKRGPCSRTDPARYVVLARLLVHRARVVAARRHRAHVHGAGRVARDRRGLRSRRAARRDGGQCERRESENRGREMRKKAMHDEPPGGVASFARRAECRE